MKGRDVLMGDKMITKLKARRHTNVRMRHEQTAEDIVKAVMELDQQGVETKELQRILLDCQDVTQKILIRLLHCSDCWR